MMGHTANLKLGDHRISQEIAEPNPNVAIVEDASDLRRAG